MDLAANKRVVESLWKTLYTKDWEALGAILHDEVFYEDVPAPDPGARGRANVIRRLRIGLDPNERFEHHFHRIVAEGQTVAFEHTEVWHFHTGEVVRNPFVTIHEVADGRIKLWRDYWDLNTLMSSVPKWWIEHVAKFSEKDFA
ncbi:MAG: nuclear transport factor 2 family protein [Myxococcales bacterium]|nr:MAG: nuclear transport factor 2 family protein [Myxococcales bacterium]